MERSLFATASFASPSRDPTTTLPALSRTVYLNVAMGRLPYPFQDLESGLILVRSRTGSSACAIAVS